MVFTIYAQFCSAVNSLVLSFRVDIQAISGFAILAESTPNYLVRSLQRDILRAVEIGLTAGHAHHWHTTNVVIPVCIEIDVDIPGCNVRLAKPVAVGPEAAIGSMLAFNMQEPFFRRKRKIATELGRIVKMMAEVTATDQSVILVEKQHGRVSEVQPPVLRPLVLFFLIHQFDVVLFGKRYAIMTKT